jgi:hypothetical protein
MTMQAVPPEQQDAVEKLTAAAPGIGASASGQGGGEALPQGSLKLSSPNFLSKAARKDLYRVMVAAGFVTVVLGVAVILQAHTDTDDHWVMPSVTLLLVGFGGWLIAYATVGGFGNVEVVIGSGSGDGAPPTATGPVLDPADGATDVPLDSSITATFSTALSADTVTEQSFTLSDAASALVAAAVSYDLTAKKATLKPNQALTAATKYTAALTDAIKDQDDKAQAATTWTFTTKSA